MLSALTLGTGAVAVVVTGGELLTVSSLTYPGGELLVAPAELPPAYRVHGKRAGITLLHPWANRLAADSYDFDGIAAHVGGGDARVTRDPNGLAIHGVMSRSPWQLIRSSDTTARATLAWLGEPAFPFAHEISVEFSLSADDAGRPALEIDTQVTALGDARVPISFGWHPYFHCERTAGTELDLPARAMLTADAHGLPTGHAVAHGAERILLGDRAFDDGVAELRDGSAMAVADHARTISVEFTRGYPDGQIFAPEDAAVVSLEPMTAPTNALCRGYDLPVAEAGRPFAASFTVRVGDGIA